MRKGIEIQHSELTYDEKKPIGRGAYGQVFKGSFRKEDVAIKIYDFKGVLSSEEKQNMLLEAQTMDRLRSKYLVGLRGVFFEPNYGLVMEFCAGGTLSQTLKNSDIPLDFARQLQWGMEISYGLHALHSVRIFHRDLKGDNILLTETRQAKIGDFGLAQIKSASASQSKHIDHSAAGTIPWMAPELFDKKPHTSAADMYSLGMVLWEIISRQTPFQGIMPFVIVGMIMAGKREALPSGCPRIFQELITACWDADPSKRPTAEKVGEQFEAAWRSVKGLPMSVTEIKNPTSKASVNHPLISKTYRIPTTEERLFFLSAVETENLTELTCYLVSGLSPDTVDENKSTLLYIMVRKNNYEGVKLLLEYQASVNLPSPINEFDSIDPCISEDLSGNITPLISATNQNNPLIVRLLLAYKADVNFSKGQLTPLSTLLMGVWRDDEKPNCSRIVNMLLEAHADIQHCCYGQSALFCYYDGAVLKTLLEHKANVNVQLDKTIKKLGAAGGETPLFGIVRYDMWNTDVLLLLLQNKADVNHICSNGQSALFGSIIQHKFYKIRLLLEANADTSIKVTKIDLRDDFKLDISKERNSTIKKIGGYTPLIVARKLHNESVKGNKEIIEFIEACEKKQSQQSEVLFAAIDRGDYKLTKNALESKAIVTRVNKEGHSPLFVASQKGLTQIVKLLLEYNAKVDQAKLPGFTPLATAAFRGHLEVVRILLEAKADPTVKSVSGETPQQVALRHGHHAVAALFQPRPSSGQESCRETKYETSAITSSTGNTTQSDIPPITDIKESSSSSMSSSITASSSSSTSASVSSPAISSGTSTQTVSEIKSSITETPGTLFSINQPKSSDSELRQPLIPKPPKPENSSRCCLIL